MFLYQTMGNICSFISYEVLIHHVTHDVIPDGCRQPGQMAAQASFSFCPHIVQCNMDIFKYTHIPSDLDAVQDKEICFFKVKVGVIRQHAIL